MEDKFLESTGKLTQPHHILEDFSISASSGGVQPMLAPATTFLHSSLSRSPANSFSQSGMKTQNKNHTMEKINTTLRSYIHFSFILCSSIHFVLAETDFENEQVGEIC